MQFGVPKIKGHNYCVIVGSINEYFGNNKKILQISLNVFFKVIIIRYLVLTLIVYIDKDRTDRSLRRIFLLNKCSCIGIVLFPLISLVQEFFKRVIARLIASGNHRVAIHLVWYIFVTTKELEIGGRLFLQFQENS